MRTLRKTAFIITLVVLGLPGGAERAVAVFPGANGKVAFATNRDGNSRSTR